MTEGNIQDDSKVFGLGSQRDGVAISDVVKTGRSRLVKWWVKGGGDQEFGRIVLGLRCQKTIQMNLYTK